MFPIYIYILLQSLKWIIGIGFLMSSCFDYKTMFPDTCSKISRDSHIYASKTMVSTWFQAPKITKRNML